jgi:dihydropteroate synthase
MTAADRNILEWPKGKLDFSKGPILMGILNVTPDSFSNGGQFLDTEKAVAHAIQMAADGAALIDVGPESTRPGSKPVSTAEQIRRAIPVIKQLAKKFDIPISIDTYNCHVAKAALEAGASIINDITTLADDRMAQLAAQQQVPVVLMHMQGTPQTMQLEPKYKDVVREVRAFLLKRAEKAQEFGIPKERICIDPGIGFGKTFEHNLELIKNLHEFVATGYRVLVGTSRKSFLGKLTGRQDPRDRIFGTAATLAIGLTAGVSILRVHDVRQMMDVLRVAAALTKP